MENSLLGYFGEALMRNSGWSVHILGLEGMEGYGCIEQWSYMDQWSEAGNVIRKIPFARCATIVY